MCNWRGFNRIIWIRSVNTPEQKPVSFEPSVVIMVGQVENERHPALLPRQLGHKRRRRKKPRLRSREQNAKNQKEWKLTHSCHFVDTFENLFILWKRKVLLTSSSSAKYYLLKNDFWKVYLETILKGLLKAESWSVFNEVFQVTGNTITGKRTLISLKTT